MTETSPELVEYSPGRMPHNAAMAAAGGNIVGYQDAAEADPPRRPAIHFQPSNNRIGLRHASDHVLVEAGRHGDEDAFAEMYRRTFARVCFEARRALRNHADAADAVSMAYASTFRAIRRGGGPHGPLLPYLLQSVRNSARMVVRPIRFNAEIPRGDMPDRPDPASTHFEAEDEDVKNAFSALPDRWRLVLWRVDVEQRDARDLMDEFGISANAIAALTQRARAGFRARYNALPADADAGRAHHRSV